MRSAVMTCGVVVEQVTVEQVTGIEPALSAWELARNPGSAPVAAVKGGRCRTAVLSSRLVGVARPWPTGVEAAGYEVLSCSPPQLRTQRT
jgi:hypothetical protein